MVYQENLLLLLLLWWRKQVLILILRDTLWMKIPLREIFSVLRTQLIQNLKIRVWILFLCREHWVRGNWVGRFLLSTWQRVAEEGKLLILTLCLLMIHGWWRSISHRKRWRRLIRLLGTWVPSLSGHCLREDQDHHLCLSKARISHCRFPAWNLHTREWRRFWAWVWISLGLRNPFLLLRWFISCVCFITVWFNGGSQMLELILWITPCLFRLRYCSHSWILYSLPLIWSIHRSVGWFSSFWRVLKVLMDQSKSSLQ